MHKPFNEIQSNLGFMVSQNPLAPQNQAALAAGSGNALMLGQGYYRPCKAPTSQGAATGSRVMAQVGKTWGGIKDIGPVQSSGSVFEDIGRSIWGIGAGQVHIAGTDISGATLSSILKVILPVSGSYTHANSGPFSAGLAQPSAASVGITSNVGSISKPISIKIERRRAATGARSRASTTSAVVTPTGNTVRVTFPAATTGQSHWAVFATIQGFGGVGVHYRVAYAGALDIPESTVNAGTVDGVPRSIEIDFKDGDLFPEEASFDDFPPPAGTHATRLANAMHVLGCYADTVTTPTSTNTGTAIAVSKPNNYESYVPSHLLFLPEQIVDVMARSQDNYAYVGCQNSIHAIQYVGYRGEELPVSTITTILPDIGIQYSHNWCQFNGRLCLYTAEGNLVLMTPTGELDTEFSAPIQKHIQSWATADTVVGHDPRTDCLTVSNGLEILAFCLKNGRWSPPIYLQDYGFSAPTRILSATTSARRLYFTLTDGSAFTAYSFDTTAADVPLAFVSGWQTNPSQSLGKTLHELTVTLETDKSYSPLILAIQTNLFPNALRDVSTTNGAATVTSATARFDESWTGRRIAIFGPNIGGVGIDYLITRITGFSSATVATIAHTPQATLSSRLAFIGEWIQDWTLKARAGGQHVPTFFPNVSDAISYSVALWFVGRETGQPSNAILSGSVKPISRIAEFNFNASGELA